MNMISDTMPRIDFILFDKIFISWIPIPRDNINKYVKICPLFKALNNRSKQLPVERNLSFDEQIVPLLLTLIKISFKCFIN